MTEEPDVEILPAIRSGLTHGERAELDGILSSLTPKQLDFLEVRLHTETDQEAYEIANVHRNTMLKHDGNAKVSRAYYLMRKASLIEGHMLAVEKISRLVPKAIAVLESCLSSDNEWLQRTAAIDVLQHSGLTPSTAIQQEQKPIEVSELAKWIAAARMLDAAQVPSEQLTLEG